MNQSNLQLVIDKFGHDYQSTSSSEIKYNCPFCMKRRGKPDNDHKLYVNVDKLKFICFKCHAKGRLRHSKVLESSYGIYNELIHYTDHNDIESNEDDENMYYVNNVAIPDGSLAFEYCMSRGIDRDKINFYNLKLGTDDLFGRIVIPNYMYTNIWTDMYSSRTYLNQIPKYKNPPNCKKSNSVFNLHNIPDSIDKLYIVEGAITAICAGKDTICTYGCHPSESQINQILDKHPKSIVCSYDGDEAGQLGQTQLLEMISRKYNGDLYYITMPEGIDAADMGESRYKKYVEANMEKYISNTYKTIYDFVRS